MKGNMKKGIILTLLFICSVAMLSNFLTDIRIGGIPDSAVMGLLGFGLLAGTFFLKRAIKIR
jgi:hypothetical protein